MTQDLKRCVIQICDVNGNICGTGFVVDAKIAVTCAHVIGEAGAVPGDSVTIKFAQTGASFTAEVVTDAWSPPEERDIAILRLSDELPAGVKPALLWSNEETAGHNFRAFGYPKIGEFNGIWAEGKILGLIGDPQSKNILQLRTQEIKAGMSGAPVLDTNLDRIVGMVTATYYPPDDIKFRDAAFATPVETIQEIWPSLELTPPPKIISQRPSTYLAPFHAPPLPSHFIPRPEVSDAVKKRLMGSKISTPGILVISALYGMGGIGKSVLAAALAHDPEVLVQFPDGVLWATLGQQPELLSLLNSWIQALGDYGYSPLTVNAATTHLRTLLHDKAVLMVVDDVWNPDHVMPFLVGSSRCKILITTRRADIANVVGATPYKMGVMTPEQSLALFAARVGRELVGEEREEAGKLAETIDHLPLSLELAAVQIVKNVSCMNLRKAFEDEIARLETLEGSLQRHRKHEARLEISFNLSWNALRAENEEAWQAFLWLGILPEDATIAAPMAATLWGKAEPEAAKLLELLWNKALLLPGLPVLIKGQEWPGYRLHDLHHDGARRILTSPKPEGLGLSLEEAHLNLLERYQARTQKNQWGTLPDDGYIHSHLVWHMEQTGKPDKIHALLKEETCEGHSAWYEARERFGQTAGYLADVHRAWQLAKEEVPGTTSSSQQTIGLQCRYALITTSLKSLTEKTPSEVMITLVKKGIWTPLQGFIFASQIPDSSQRWDTLLALLPYIQKALHEEALTTLFGIYEKDKKKDSLLYLHGPVKEALALAQKIQDEKKRTETLTEVSSHPNESLIKKALAVTQEIAKKLFRDKSVTEITPPPKKQQEEILQEVKEDLAAARESGYRRFNDEYTLPRLVSQLAELGHLEEALATAIEIQNQLKEWGIPVMTRLAPHLTEPLLRKLMVNVKENLGGYIWAETVIALAPHLTEPLCKEVLNDMLESVGGGAMRAKVLIAIAPRLPETLQGEALQKALEYTCRAQSPIVFLNTLALVISRLAELGYPEKALAIIKETEDDSWWRWRTESGIKDEMWQALTLSCVAPYLTEPLLRKALAIAQGIENEELRKKALGKLLPDLIEASHPYEALRIRDEKEQAQALSCIVPTLAELGYPNEALAAAREIKSEEFRAEALIRIVLYLPAAKQAGVIQEAVTVVQKIEDERTQSQVLTRLAPYLAKLGQPHIISDVAREIGSQRFWTEVLTEIPPYLPEALLQEALALTTRHLGDRDRHERSEAFAGIVSRLAELGHVDEAMIAVREIEWEDCRRKALVRLAPYLTETLLREAMTISREKETIAKLVPQLAKFGHPEEAWDTIREFHHSWQVDALGTMAPHLTGHLIKEALTVVREIRNDESRLTGLITLLPYLKKSLFRKVVREALSIAWKIEKEVDRVKALSRLVPLLPKRQQHKTIREVLAFSKQIEYEWTRAEALATVAPHLPKAEQQEVLWESLSTVLIRNLSHRETIIREILPKLVPQLALLPQHVLVQLWQEKILPTLADDIRRDLLSHLSLLSPVIVVLGGAEGVRELIKAIQDVGRWWP